MARTGVSYAEVAEAALQLVGFGKNPTVEQVRLILGTGSSTTLANHLRLWKANQETSTLLSAKENIPSELVAVMKGLWERVNNHALEKIAVIETSHQQEIAELQKEVEKYKANNQRWQQLFNQWQQEKTQLAHDKLTLDQALEFAHKENALLSTKQDALFQQLQNKQERIDELHRLQKQAQANLEHDRESAREQRLLDQQQAEQQKQQLQTDIKTLHEQLIMQREKVSVLQNQQQTLNQAYATLETNYAEVQAQHEQVKAKLEEANLSKNTYHHASQHWQTQHQALEKILEEKSHQFIEQKTAMHLLAQQIATIKQTLNETQEQNKLLSHEKWTVMQEKAHLEGRLSQMQKSLTLELQPT